MKSVDLHKRLMVCPNSIEGAELVMPRFPSPRGLMPVYYEEASQDFL